MLHSHILGLRRIFISIPNVKSLRDKDGETGVRAIVEAKSCVRTPNSDLIRMQERVLRWHLGYGSLGYLNQGAQRGEYWRQGSTIFIPQINLLTMLL
jgi:hypothetical protein